MKIQVFELFLSQSDIVFQAGAEHWLNLGVDGIKISDLSLAAKSTELSKLVAAVQGNRTDDTKKK